MSQHKALFSTRTTATIIGILFLIATSSYMLGNSLVTSALDAPDFLERLSSSSTQVEIGVLLKFVTAAANIGIGVLFFPILKKFSETIALGYLATKIIDGAGIMMVGIGSFSIVLLSRETTGAADSLLLANLIASASEMTYFVTMIALGLGAMPFCYLLYRSRLVPQPLAVLGFIGYAALFAGSLLDLLGYNLMMVHYAPGGLFEVLLPIWLIFRGFQSPAIEPTLDTSVTAKEHLGESPA